MEVKICGTTFNMYSQIIKCAYSASVTARTDADYASRVRLPRHADASSYATHIAARSEVRIRDGEKRALCVSYNLKLFPKY